LKPGKACYCSVENILSSSSLSNNLDIKIQRTKTLPVVLYGFETWEKLRVRDFDNRVSRRTFGAVRDELRWNWRKLLNEELNDL